MKLQDCFIGQKVGVNSKSKGVIVGTVSSMFETKDVDRGVSIWYADVSVDGLGHNLEIKVSKLLGVLN